jgi:serine/threonine protein kinase
MKAPFIIGRQGERYSIVREIGSGTSAMVFLAEDLHLRRQVAIKRLHPHLLGSHEAVGRFRKEALAVAALSHENIVRLYDAGDMDGRLFLAMEYVEGYSLDEVLRRHPGPLPNLVSLEILRQLLSGLAAAHRQSIVHRDVKPSNVLVDLEGGVRLTDFGLANLTGESSLTLTGALLGTPQFMAPEQVMGKEAGAKSDIFGAGLIFYRSLTGKHAFPGKTPQETLLAISRCKFSPPFLSNPKTLPCLLPLLNKMLAKDPGERGGADTCMTSLETIRAEEGFSLGRKTLARFLLDSEGARKEEERDLGELYAARAKSLRLQNFNAASLRVFAVAEQFGIDSEQTIEFLALRKKMRLFRTVTALSVLATGIFLAFMILERRTAAPEVLPSEASKVSIPAFSTLVIAPTDSGKTTPESTPRLETQAVAKTAKSPERIREKIPPHTVPTATSAPEPSQVSFLLKTKPPFAEVYIDGAYVGTTPMREPMLLTAGLHRIRIRREFWAPLDTTVDLKEGLNGELRVEMTPEFQGTSEN